MEFKIKSRWTQLIFVFHLVLFDFDVASSDVLAFGVLKVAAVFARKQERSATGLARRRPRIGRSQWIDIEFNA